MAIKVNIPETGKERIVILGAGFAGLQIARRLKSSSFQVVLVDRNNFHQFQPLYYQVAMAGLEPGSISFPLRKGFQNESDIHIRVLEVKRVDLEARRVVTEVGILNYDKLIIATGARTNYFGNDNIRENTYSLKSVSEAILLRNSILEDFEKALTITDFDERQGYLDIVIVGGGPTGVEVAGALAEMKRFILPKEYPELDVEEIDIYLIQAMDQLLEGMSEKSSEAALRFLQEIGVEVLVNSPVKDVSEGYVQLEDDTRIRSNKVIWAAGVTANAPDGIPSDLLTQGNRIKVDRFNRVEGYEEVFAVGDVALMEETDYPNGHPQVAPVAIQQATHLAKNLKLFAQGNEMNSFAYKNKGSLATIGRNKAVADLPNWHSEGFIAWFIWGIVHLFSLIGTKNRLFVFLNWIWNYFTYDQSLRLIIKPAVKTKKGSPDSELASDP